MQTEASHHEIKTLDVRQEIRIAAPVEVAFEALLEELGPGGELPDGTPFPMKLEPRPGGRYYRDLGNDAGHLWGFVQVIKPPKLLELTGPLFMSYPAASHVQYRLTPEGAGTLLKLVHRAFGQIPPEDLEGVDEGWAHSLGRVRQIAERKAAGEKP